MTGLADRELRALRIELLIARAELERQQLLQGLDGIEGRTRGVRRLARALMPRKPERAMRLASTAIAIARRQAWIAPIVAGLARRALRVRAVRWVLLFGAVAATAWWFVRSRGNNHAAMPNAGSEPAIEADESAPLTTADSGAW